MKKTQTLALLATCLTSLSVAAADDFTSDAGFFAEGQKQFTLFGGSGSAFDETYIVLGAGIRYYVIDGLNIGLDVETWTSGDPGILKITASSQYVFYQAAKVKPYVGLFYRYTDVEDVDSIESVGGRAGVYLQMGRNSHVGLGGVYESYIDCNTRVWSSCDATYPEVSFTFAF